MRNPDGSLASRHEIEKALYEEYGRGGKTLLAGLLGYVYTDPQWSIRIWGEGKDGWIGSMPAPCGILPVDPCIVGGGALTVSTPLDAQGWPVGTLELSGSVGIANNGRLGRPLLAELPSGIVL